MHVITETNPFLLIKPSFPISFGTTIWAQFTKHFIDLVIKFVKINTTTNLQLKM
jgi:hypothetical protein